MLPEQRAVRKHAWIWRQCREAWDQAPIEQRRHWSSRRGDHQQGQRTSTLFVAAIVDPAESPTPSMPLGTPVLGASPFVVHGVGASLMSPGALADITAGMAAQQPEWPADRVLEPAKRRRIPIQSEPTESKGLRA